MRQALMSSALRKIYLSDPDVAVIVWNRPLTVEIRVPEQGADAKQHHAADPRGMLPSNRLRSQCQYCR